MRNFLVSMFVMLFLIIPFLWLFFVIKKEKFQSIIKRQWSRKQITLFFLSLFASSFIGIGVFADSTTAQLVESTNENTVVALVDENKPSENITVEQVEDSVESEFETVKVVRVVDGDTIEIEGGKKVRYIGIDTPESVHPSKPVECFSSESTKKNKELVEGKEVRLEKDVSETDRYGRLLRYVYVGDTFVNNALVSEGYAQSSSYPPDIKHQSVFIESERQARENNKGLWGDTCLVATPTPVATVKPIPKASATPKQTTIPSPTKTPTTPTSGGGYNCNCSKTCTNMSSCEEAYYQLNNCGCSARDGDDDGVPCESICPGG